MSVKRTFFQRIQDVIIYIRTEAFLLYHSLQSFSGGTRFKITFLRRKILYLYSGRVLFPLRFLALLAFGGFEASSSLFSSCRLTHSLFSFRFSHIFVFRETSASLRIMHEISSSSIPGEKY